MRDLPVAAKKGDPLEQIEESLWSASWYVVSAGVS